MLKEIIIERIRREGPLSFRDFMEMALFYPEYGYYTSPTTEIGIKGDYYTSPHLHWIFGVMVGRQIEEMWEFMGKPQDFTIIEMGAGRGYLAEDMLTYLRDRPLFHGMRYIVVEVNPHMVKKQEKILSPFRDKIIWASSLDGISGITGCVVSNELIDSFPVHVIQRERDVWREVCIDVDRGDLLEVMLPVGREVERYIEEYEIPPLTGYRTEVNLMMNNWLDDISHVLTEGFLFSIDYGYPAWQYYDKERMRGTLLCYYRHRLNEDPYRNIGSQDITAHVNFTSLKRWGETSGLTTVGYCPQGPFLISTRIDRVIEETFGESKDVPLEIMKIKGLLLPEGMGESHKVCIQYKGKGAPRLSGFTLRNQRDIL